MSSRSLDDLRPEFRVLVDPFLEDCKAASIDILVTCTLRSGAEQDALYAQGRTAPGAIVTKAQAGQSAHQYGLALDLVPIVNGKPDWSGTDTVWNEVIRLGIGGGLHSLQPMERAHFEHPAWKALAGV